MTYRIEITAETLAELAGKAVSLAAKLNTGTATESVPAVKGAITTNEVAPEVAEAAPENPTPTPKSVPSAEETESQPTTTQPSTTHAKEPTSSGRTEAPKPSCGAEEKTPTASTSDTLNFDTDVAPIVLQVVKEKGKPVVQEILEQFGVERASLLDPARWPELVDQLKDAL